MARFRNRSLPYAGWPAEDRHRWEAVFEKCDFFDEHSRAHLAAVTRSGLQTAYGLALQFLMDNHPKLLDLAPDARFTGMIIGEYVGHTRQNCRETTVANRIERLSRVLTALFPASDSSWLRAIGRRIAYRARPICHKQVPIIALFELGLELMERAIGHAEAERSVTIEGAELFRDGLSIAFLAAIPLRRSSFAKVLLEEHLRRVGCEWRLDIPPEETKNRVALQFDLFPTLSHYLDLYTSQFRPSFSGADDHPGLWPSMLGRPMSGQAIYRRVKRRTKSKFGVGVSLHQFRSAAATLWSVEDPANVRGVKDLLGQLSFAVTEKHYIRSQSRMAGRALASAIHSIARVEPTLKAPRDFVGRSRRSRGPELPD